MPKPPDTLPPVRPNAAIETKYRARLLKMIEDMHASSVYWISAAYKANEPEVLSPAGQSGMVFDESPAAAMEKVVRGLSRRWQKRFNETAKDLGDYFAQAVANRSDAALKAILKKGGFSVEFKLTSQMNDVLQATIGEQVGLIKSIPQRYLTDVQGAVMRSVQQGRDLGWLTKELQKDYGIARRRAKFIASDQINKATANITKVRQQGLGITEAEWRHSGGGKHKRPSHVAAGKNRVRYQVSQGWFDPEVKEYIYPGTLPGCKCTSRSVISGFR